MDPVEMLIDGAVQHQVVHGEKNPYLTMETFVLRLVSKILDRTRISPSSLTGLIANSTNGNGKNQNHPVNFPRWHEDIRSAYETKLRHGMSQEERAVVERVLSKDHPHPSELSKFASCLYKYDRFLACRLFAVDGLLGTHPKSYVADAFSNRYAGHNAAVRELYAFFDDPDEIRSVVMRAYQIAHPGTVSTTDDDSQPPLEPQCVGLYADMVGEEEMDGVVTERLSKSKQQSEKQQPAKRKGDGRKNNGKRQKIVVREPSPAFSPFSPPGTPPSSPARPKDL